MNRRNLIKSIPLLGFAPFVQAEEYPWPLECTLAPFQKKIWEAYNKYDKNIFVLPPKSGATFMYNRLFEIAESQDTDILIFDNFGPDGTPAYQGTLRLGHSETKEVIFVKNEFRNENWLKLILPNYEVLEFTKEEVKPFG
jgi:hypothetical protein